MAKKKHTIFALYTGDDWNEDQPYFTPSGQNTYRVWHQVAQEFDVELLQGSLYWFKNGRFTKYWRYEGERGWKKINRSVKPTIVFDKSNFIVQEKYAPDVHAAKKEIFRHLPMLNIPEFTFLIDNKLNQAAIFHEFMPPTIFYPLGTEVATKAGQPLVLKNLFGYGGENVTLLKKPKGKLAEPLVQQKFIKSVGPQGRVQDLRIFFLGDRPLYAYNRIAKKGSLYTNVHRGADTKLVELSSIKKVLKLADKMLEPLAVFQKKIFTFDFMIESRSQKPYLIEMNTMPGFEVFMTAQNQTVAQRERKFKGVLSSLTKYLLS